MNKERKRTMFSIIFIVVLVGMLVFVSMSYINLRREYQLQLSHIQRRENTINLLQQDDIQELLSHVSQVMAGEIIYEPDDGDHMPIGAYSFNSRRRERYPDTYTIESGLTVLEISVDGDSGEIVVFYFISYLDSDGNPVMGESVAPYAPTIWRIEREEGEWVIVEILDFKMWRDLPRE